MFAMVGLLLLGDVVWVWPFPTTRQGPFWSFPATCLQTSCSPLATGLDRPVQGNSVVELMVSPRSVAGKSGS